VLYDGTENKAASEALEDYKDTGAVPYVNRSPKQLGSIFGGLEMLEPGLVRITHWRSDPAAEARPVDAYGAAVDQPREVVRRVRCALSNWRGQQSTSSGRRPRSLGGMSTPPVKRSQLIAHAIGGRKI
jgi:hypothetical protein